MSDLWTLYFIVAAGVFTGVLLMGVFNAILGAIRDVILQRALKEQEALRAEMQRAQERMEKANRDGTTVNSAAAE